MGLMTRWPRLRFTPILWGLTALLTALNLATWFAQRSSIYETERAAALRELEITTNAFAEETQQMFEQIDLVLRGIRAYHLHTGSVAETERYINDLKLGEGRIENGYLVDDAGRLVITHNPATVGRSVADRDYFQFHRSTAADVPFVSAVELGRATGKYLFRVTRRIDDERGEFAGLSLVTVAPGSIARFYSRLIRNDGSIASLVGIRDRKLRARVPEPGSEVWSRPLDIALWNELKQRPSGSYTAPGGVDGVLRHYVYRAIPTWDMVILTGVPESQVRARAENGIVRSTVITVGSNLVLFAFAYALSLIDRQRRRMKALASTDVLTGLPNRRELFDLGERELARALRYRRPFAVLMLDVDHFKKVNDRFGHATGDRVLQALSHCGRKALREPDLFGRFGGEEFLVLLPETDEEGAKTLAERLRAGAQACTDGLNEDGQPVSFTVSIGIAVQSNQQPASLEALIRLADEALYRAKANGRNRVELGEASTQPGSAK